MLDPQHHLTLIQFSKSEFQKAYYSTQFREFVNYLSEKKTINLNLIAFSKSIPEKTFR
jgi:hypothetical protein